MKDYFIRAGAYIPGTDNLCPRYRKGTDDIQPLPPQVTSSLEGGRRASVRFWLGGLGLSLLAIGCRPAAPEARPVQLVEVHREGQRAIAISFAPGVQINALVAPTLERHGQVPLAIARGSRTADSAYYAEPPWTPRGDVPAGRGELRVSYCRTSEAYCQVQVFPVTLD